MGRRLHYSPGDWYVTDDRTGFPQRASQCRKQWDGLLVHDRVWEPRHPQDMVRGVRDDQSVPDARPLTPDIFVGPVWVALSATAAPHASSLTVADATGLRVGDAIMVMLDSGIAFRTRLNALSGLTLTVRDALPSSASSGNLVCDTGVAA